HGEEKAKEAAKQAKAAFGGGNADDMLSATIDKNAEFVSDALVLCGLAKSKGEAKRLIEGGGVAVNEDKVTDPFAKISDSVKSSGEFILHKGKKAHVKVVLK
ncbi:MAG: tyrosine--tRNA ligase, partial [Clostridia bacterium]|nr:tyrosine--tRNA ligase [Clostridia bacterium]